MGFFARLGFGWRLGMTSLGVVTRDKTLMLFPVVSGIASILLVLAFVFGVGPENIAALGEQRHAAHGGGSGELPAIYYLIAFVLYMGLSFITVYFNVALLGAAQLSMGGKDTTLGDGLAIANQHLGKIFGWALITGTVGLLLSMLESNEKVGRIIRSIVGTAWAVITYFVVPVMIFENQSPPAAVGRSVSLMKSTWGENAGAQVGIGLVTLALLVGTVLVLVLGMVVIPKAAVVLVPLLIITVPLIILLGTAAKAVLAVGLYEFATKKGSGEVFKPDEMRAAFR